MKQALSCARSLKKQGTCIFPFAFYVKNTPFDLLVFCLKVKRGSQDHEITKLIRKKNDIDRWIFLKKIQQSR
jgi:hypothetical protein